MSAVRKTAALNGCHTTPNWTHTNRKQSRNQRPEVAFGTGQGNGEPQGDTGTETNGTGLRDGEAGGLGAKGKGT